MKRLLITLLLGAAACSDSTAPGLNGPPRESAARAVIPTVGFVTVATDTKLEYIDYGGTGPSLVLLAGLGNTAHVFAEFAPRLTDRYHVIALTRRGFGASSQPASGYDTGTLSADLLAALDGLRLATVYLVGHSVAGDELTRFASDHQERVGKLVYLDGAYDRVTLGQLIAAYPWPAGPPPTLEDISSPARFNRFISRVRGVSIPLEETLAQFEFAPDGWVQRERTSPEVYQAILAGIASPTYASIRAPSLAIYAVPLDAGDVLPWLTAASPDWPLAQFLLREVYGPFYTRERGRFDAEVPTSQVIEMRGAPHYLFISNSAAVVTAIKDFLGR